MRAVRATLRGALQEAFANRAGFWSQVTLMTLNDVAWIVFWVLFFERVGRVRGWGTEEIIVLQAALTVSGGLVLGILGNARSIGRLVADGGIDAALALPVRPLSHLLVRRVNTVFLGDLAFGLILFAVAGQPDPTRVAVFVGVTLTAAAVLAGFLVAVGSVAFFAGRDDAGELGFHAMLLFSAYPVDVFGGAAKVVLHTLVPAAFIAAVPAKLVNEPDPVLALALVAAAVAFVAAGAGLFTLGLRRYTSGAVWTRA